MRTIKYLSLISVVAIIIAGCATKAQLEPGGAYNGNAFLYNCDKTLTDAKDTLNNFVTFEMNMREKLAAQNLQAVTAAADAIRTNAPTWFAVAAAARGAYLLALTNQPAQIPSASNALFLATTAVNGQATAATAIKTAIPIK